MIPLHNMNKILVTVPSIHVPRPWHRIVLSSLFLSHSNPQIYTNERPSFVVRLMTSGRIHTIRHQTPAATGKPPTYIFRDFCTLVFGYSIFAFLFRPLRRGRHYIIIVLFGIIYVRCSQSVCVCL